MIFKASLFERSWVVVSVIMSIGLVVVFPSFPAILLVLCFIWLANITFYTITVDENKISIKRAFSKRTYNLCNIEQYKKHGKSPIGQMIRISFQDFRSYLFMAPSPIEEFEYLLQSQNNHLLEKNSNIKTPTTRP